MGFCSPFRVAVLMYPAQTGISFMTGTMTSKLWEFKDGRGG